jgi:ABC-type transporter Mla subunit MlaD
MDVVGSVAAVQQLSLVIGQALFKINKYYCRAKQAVNEASHLRDELDTSVSLVAMLSGALSDSTDDIKPSLERTVRKFLATVEQLNKRIHPNQTTGINKLTWPLKKDENEKLISQIESYKETLHLALVIQKSSHPHMISADFSGSIFQNKWTESSQTQRHYVEFA